MDTKNVWCKHKFAYRLADYLVFSASKAFTVCFSDSVIRYGNKMGPIGQAVELPPLPNEDVQRATKDWSYDAIDCRRVFHNELNPTPVPGRELLVLKSGQGYLDLRPLRAFNLIFQTPDDTFPGKFKLYCRSQPQAAILPI